MTQERTTPEDGIEQPGDGTPEGNQPTAPQTDPGPDQSPAPDSRIAQAEYTRATQLAATIRRELGLPKTATQAEVTAAIAALKAPPRTEDDEEVDPRVAEYEARARAAELQLTAAIYGQEFTEASIALVNLARSTDSIDELMGAFAEFRDKYGAAAAAAVADAAEAGEGDDEGEDEDQGPPDAGLGLSEGERSRQTTAQPSGGRRRESGVVGAVRGIFQAASEQRRR